MNNYFNRTNFEKESQRSSKLPKWVWILAAVGLILAVLLGYTSGTEIALTLKSSILQDTNGEDTSLQTLDFSEFLGVFYGRRGYNFIDSELSFAPSYNTTVKFDSVKGTYPNDFANTNQVNYKVEFNFLSYYDISYAKKSENDVTFTFTSQIKKGNFQARILRIDDNYKVKTNSRNTDIIEDTSIYTELICNAGETNSITLPGGHIYVIAVAAESAFGSYTVSVV